MPRPQRLNPLETQQEIVISTNLAGAATTELALHIELLYDYSQIPDPAAAQSAQQAARRIKQRSQRIGNDMLDIGQALTTAKEIIPHGQWLPWLETEFKINPKGAERFMAAYETFKDRRAEASFFNPSVLAIMASRKFPEAARQDLIAQAKATGQSPTRRDAEAANQQHKSAPNSTLASNLKNTHTGDSSKVLTKPSESSPNPVTVDPSPRRVYAPTWQLINLIIEWLDSYLDGKGNERQKLPIVSNLRTQVQPYWGKLNDYLAERQIHYQRTDIHTAILDVEARLRSLTLEVPLTTPAFFLNIDETLQLILHVVQSESDGGLKDSATAQDRYDSLLRLCTLRDYTHALPPNVTISNKLFQRCYVQAKESLRSQAQIAASQTEPEPEPQPEDSQPVTIQLHPDTVVILAHALRNRSFYNLHQSIIDEILEALQ